MMEGVRDTAGKVGGEARRLRTEAVRVQKVRKGVGRWYGSGGRGHQAGSGGGVGRDGVAWAEAVEWCTRLMCSIGTGRGNAEQKDAPHHFFVLSTVHIPK